jgi:hypothetical protein
MIPQSKTKEDSWSSFQIEESDLEFLYNFLLEIETPQTPHELIKALVEERIRKEKAHQQEQEKVLGMVYKPAEEYKTNDVLIFPAIGWQKGTVINVRPAKNPDLPSFNVLDVYLDSGKQMSFASGLQDHVLNHTLFENPTGKQHLEADQVIRIYSSLLLNRLNSELERNPDLVRIAGRWFPRALLVDVNIGYLNMAEALLDMENGGPLPTSAILEQIELPTDVNIKLTEFSLNLALQEDSRFDEVGPAGEIVWFLHRLEPDSVQNIPHYLRYQPIEFDIQKIDKLQKILTGRVFDELQPELASSNPVEALTISLPYPHWRAGTLPLVGSLASLFPTAYEAPRIRFTFFDENTHKEFSGWVVLKEKYVYGLRDWYVTHGLMPGSNIHISRGKVAEQVTIKADLRRPTREWIRTALVGADGGVVFAMLKQLVPAAFDERMAIAIPDTTALDKIWQGNIHSRTSLEATVLGMMRELAKLNPQGHVHAQELYAAINIVRRCPPGPILSILINSTWAKYLGDLYFRLEETNKGEENVYA